MESANGTTAAAFLVDQKNSTKPQRARRITKVLLFGSFVI